MSRARSGYREGAIAVAPLAAPIVLFGASFGVLANAAGMGTVAPVVMSATTFAGSAQFAAASILGAGGVAAAVAAAVLLNARYAPIGLSVASEIHGPRWQRLVKAQLIVDESWAVAKVEGGFDGRRLLGAGALLYVTWVTGTLLGVVAGDVLGDPERIGLDAAFPAIFLALLVPQLGSRAARVAAVAGATMALAITPFAQAGVPIIAASAAAVVGWRVGR